MAISGHSEDQALDAMTRDFCTDIGDLYRRYTNDETIKELTESEMQEVIANVRSSCTNPHSRREIDKALFVELCRVRETKRQAWEKSKTK